MENKYQINKDIKEIALGYDPIDNSFDVTYMYYLKEINKDVEELSIPNYIKFNYKKYYFWQFHDSNIFKLKKLKYIHLKECKYTPYVSIKGLLCEKGFNQDFLYIHLIPPKYEFEYLDFSSESYKKIIFVRSYNGRNKIKKIIINNKQLVIFHNPANFSCGDLEICTNKKSIIRNNGKWKIGR